MTAATLYQDVKTTLETNAAAPKSNALVRRVTNLFQENKDEQLMRTIRDDITAATEMSQSEKVSVGKQFESYEIRYATQPELVVHIHQIQSKKLKHACATIIDLTANKKLHVKQENKAPISFQESVLSDGEKQHYSAALTGFTTPRRGGVHYI